MSEGRGWPHDPVDRGGPAPPVAVAEPVALSVREAPPPEAPAAPTTRPVAFVALVVVLCVATLVSVSAITDWWVRNRELDVLLDRIAVAEAAQRPLAQSLFRIERSCLATGRCDAVALQLAAQAGLPALQSTGDVVAATEIVRFHTSIRALRDRYLDHNRAWRDWIGAIASGQADLEQPDAIATTFRAAGQAAERAIPPLPRHDASARVQEIFFS